MRLALFFAAVMLPIAVHAGDDGWQKEPSRYFFGEQPRTDVTYVHYGAFNSGFEVGFAVGTVCAAGADEEQQCIGTPGTIVVRLVQRLPATVRGETPRYAWLETSLDTCPAARERLMRLPNARWAPHMRKEYHRDRQAFEDMVFTSFEGQMTIVTADAGERVADGTMQMLAGGFIYRGNADGSGNPADWGKQMLDDLAPCLKPASVPPPWKR